MAGGTVKGAYGLALPELEGQRWLNPAAPDWPVWRFVEVREELTPPSRPSTEVAVVQGELGRVEHIDRHARTTTLSTRAPIPPHAHVHPMLAPTAAAHAEWTGRLIFHAGSFLDSGGGVWGVLGDRERGKSSMLAWLNAAGVSVFGDDLVITDGDVVPAGPRCVDLREPSAQHLGVGEDTGLEGLRRRWRVDLEEVPAEAPLRGWVDLEWRDEVSVEELSAEERMRRLGRGLGLVTERPHPLPWLGAVGRPMLVLGRPQSWERIDEAMGRLLEAVERLSDSSSPGG